jgi:hypothetical protein
MQEYLASETVSNVMPKEPFGQALTYLRNQFDHLLVYLDDGLMPIDNNETEQLMKQVALGRKNWMFIGSVAAGYRAADLMSLVSSAARNDLDVFLYVKDVLDLLLAGEADYALLRPDVWKQSHPEAIRIYRQEERYRGPTPRPSSELGDALPTRAEQNQIANIRSVGAMAVVCAHAITTSSSTSLSPPRPVGRRPEQRTEHGRIGGLPPRIEVFPRP